MTERRKVSFGLVLLFVFLLLGIATVSTVLVGRALGWWEYANLPLVGRFFPSPTTIDPDVEPEEEPDFEEQIELLQLEITQREQRISDLQDNMRKQDTRIEELLEEIETLEEQILAEQAQKADAKLAETAKIYENMRAQEAAQILEQMKTEDVRSILYLMPPEAAGAILGKMKPEKAAQIASLQVGK
ncbi:MAG TPA: hypothetical protein DDZ53_13005 [Firmicutes bacterium]|nr:hypothetical protein [Bacillota bacterium]